MRTQMLLARSRETLTNDDGDEIPGTGVRSIPKRSGSVPLGRSGVLTLPRNQSNRKTVL